MKKTVLLLTIVLCSFVFCQSQTFKIGATFGLPSADASDISDFVVGADLYYYFTDIDDFINIGATVGFRNFFVDFGPLKDAQFVPLAAAGRLKIFDAIGAGADVGYSFGLKDYLDGGFYFRPVVFWDILDTIELNLSYENVSDIVTWGYFNVGALIQF